MDSLLENSVNGVAKTYLYQLEDIVDVRRKRNYSSGEEFVEKDLDRVEPV